MADRRSAYMAGKVCPCGSTDHLTLVKKANGTDGNAHIWSYSDKQRAEALKRYIVMCATCAKERKYRLLSERTRGRAGSPTAINHDDVWAIRGRLLGKETMRTIARDYGLNHRHISDIACGKIWGWLERGRRQVFGIDYKERKVKSGKSA